MPPALATIAAALMACIALFTIMSFFCGIAASLGIILIARILQGIGGGGLAPVEQAILVDTFSPAQRASAFVLYTVAIVTAPAIGPVLGGWITHNYNWRWIFFINIPIGLLSLFLTNRFVHPLTSTLHRRHQHPIPPFYMLRELFQANLAGRSPFSTRRYTTYSRTVCAPNWVVPFETE